MCVGVGGMYHCKYRVRSLIAKRSFLVWRWVTIVDSVRLDASEQEVISVGVGGAMDHS